MEKIGIIDLGSNSARLVIVELFGDGHFMVVDELKESVRLGQDMERDGFLKPQRVAETIKTLKKNKKLSAKPARKAKETEEPDSAKDNENLSKVKDDASVQEPVEQPAPALTASAIVMSVQVRQHDIYGKTVEREGRLLLDKRAKEGDHVVVRFNDQSEEEVPCRSVTILSVETE